MYNTKHIFKKKTLKLNNNLPLSILKPYNIPFVHRHSQTCPNKAATARRDQKLAAPKESNPRERSPLVLYRRISKCCSSIGSTYSKYFLKRRRKPRKRKRHRSTMVKRALGVFCDVIWPARNICRNSDPRTRESNSRAERRKNEERWREVQLAPEGSSCASSLCRYRHGWPGAL